MKTRIFGALALAGALLFLAADSRAQTQTNVTATIVDPLGIPYAGGTYSIQLIPTGTGPTVNGQTIGGAFNGGLDASGSFHIALWPNADISPGGSQWQVTVCISPGVLPPLGTGAQCTPSIVVTVAGTNQDLSTVLNAVAPRLTVLSSAPPPTPTVIQSNSVTLTPAQIKNLVAAPQVLVPAAGAGKIIVPVFITGQMKFVSSGYGQATNVLGLEYTPGDVQISSVDISGANWADQAASTLGSNNGTLLLSLNPSQTSAVNHDVSIFNAGGTDWTLGDSPITFTVFYIILASV